MLTSFERASFEVSFVGKPTRLKLVLTRMPLRVCPYPQRPGCIRTSHRQFAMRTVLRGGYNISPEFLKGSDGLQSGPGEIRTGWELADCQREGGFSEEGRSWHAHVLLDGFTGYTGHPLHEEPQCRTIHIARFARLFRGGSATRRRTDVARKPARL